MKRKTNECVGCPSDMGCLHNACPYMGVTTFICDSCGREVNKLYSYGPDSYELCENCIEDALNDMYTNLENDEEKRFILGDNQDTGNENDELDDIFANLSLGDKLELFDVKEVPRDG